MLRNRACAVARCSVEIFHRANRLPAHAARAANGHSKPRRCGTILLAILLVSFASIGALAVQEPKVRMASGDEEWPCPEYVWIEFSWNHIPFGGPIHRQHLFSNEYGGLVMDQGGYNLTALVTVWVSYPWCILGGDVGVGELEIEMIMNGQGWVIGP